MNQNGLGWTGCVQYLYTVVFRRPPLMASCISVCICVRVCMCICVYTVYKGGYRQRDEVRREGDRVGTGLQ